MGERVPEPIEAIEEGPHVPLFRSPVSSKSAEERGELRVTQAGPIQVAWKRAGECDAPPQQLLQEQMTAEYGKGEIGCLPKY
jgi:hypothetical protein